MRRRDELSRRAGTSAGSGESKDVGWQQHSSWSEGSGNVDDRSAQCAKTLRRHDRPRRECPPKSRHRATTPLEAVNSYVCASPSSAASCFVESAPSLSATKMLSFT